jgi:hypothetical protein
VDLHLTRRKVSWLNLALVLAALLLSACGSQSPVQTRPTPTATPRALPTPVTGLLDPIPSACQPTEPPRTQQLGPLDGFSGGVQLMGDGPAWISSDLEVVHLNQLGYDPLPSTKMLWLVGPDGFPVVTIRGQDLLSGTPMWVDVYGGPGPTTTGTLGPGLPNRDSAMTAVGHKWQIWGTGLIFVKAGCYRITVSWPGGQWQIVSAVGR